jgi:hypothetical protein
VVKSKYPKAQLLNADFVRTIFLVVDEPAKYHKFASIDAHGTSIITMVKNLIQPSEALVG